MYQLFLDRSLVHQSDDVDLTKNNRRYYLHVSDTAITIRIHFSSNKKQVENYPLLRHLF